jgi:rRNA maturation endonuclease Nob1
MTYRVVQRATYRARIHTYRCLTCKSTFTPEYLCAHLLGAGLKERRAPRATA